MEFAETSHLSLQTRIDQKRCQFGCEHSITLLAEPCISISILILSREFLPAHNAHALKSM